MKRFILSLLAFASLWPAMAQAEERRLTSGDLRAMADRGALLCERGAAAGQLCDAIYLWNRVDGELTETRLESASNAPPVDTALQYPVEIRDDQVCSTLDANRTSLLVLANGRELTSEEAAPVRAAFDTVYAPVNGQVVCTAFYRDGATGLLRAEATLNGAPRAELNTVFWALDGPPLPRMRPVRQPWTLAVLRTVHAVFPDPQPSAAGPATAAAAGAPANRGEVSAPAPVTAPAAGMPASDAPATEEPATETPAAPVAPVSEPTAASAQPVAPAVEPPAAPAGAAPAPAEAPQRCSLWARLRGRCSS